MSKYTTTNISYKDIQQLFYDCETVRPTVELIEEMLNERRLFIGEPLTKPAIDTDIYVNEPNKPPLRWEMNK